MSLKKIGQNIARLREEQNLFQSDLANKAGIAQARISDIEQGKSNFEINTLVKIADALNCTLDINLKPL